MEKRKGTIVDAAANTLKDNFTGELFTYINPGKLAIKANDVVAYVRLSLSGGGGNGQTINIIKEKKV
ncbi:MAG: hypothetical protein ACOZCO_04955 [Bacteroidota bacterium]